MRLFILFCFACMLSISSKAAHFIVATDGSGDFTSVQAAVDACPDGARSFIFVKDGTYYGQTSIGTKAKASNQLISLIGESRDGVILTFDKSANSPGVSTYEEFTTFLVYAKNFYAENINFVNSAGNTGQALALYTAGDMAILKNCSMIGYQDTYRSKKGTRGYLLNCWVEGAVDFIYAGGTLIFDDCTIHCVRNGGYVVAPEDAYATVPKNQNELSIFFRLGFLFRDCTIQGPSSVPANSFYLGRPWGENCGTVYVNCKLSNQVHEKGWGEMGSSTYKTAVFGEYNSMDLNGNPVNVSKRVNWSYQIPKKDVEDHLNPEAFFARGFNSVFNPFPQIVVPVTPTFSSSDGQVMQWTASAGAVGYQVYHDGHFVGFTSTNSFNVNQLSGVLQVKALNALGVASELSSPLTGVNKVPLTSLTYNLQDGILQWSEAVKSIQVYTISGKKLFAGEAVNRVDLRVFKHQVVLIKAITQEDTSCHFKIHIQ